MTEEVLWHWATFSIESTGEVLPLNYIGFQDDLILVGHQCADGDPAITCKNGEIVRRVVITFKHPPKQFQWN